MKALLFLILTTTSHFAQAFTLADPARGFEKNKIKIRIASTDCSQAGFSTSRFRDLIQDAVDDYWNAVASSSLKLSVGAVEATDLAGLTHADVFNSNLVGNNTILAGCNEAAFSEGSSTLGGAQMVCDGDNCRSVFIINARADSLMNTLNRDEQIAVIAHELGHAIGLGHSEYSYNLMYYRIGGKHQKWLGQDDIDGVSYLYPHDPVGCDFLPLFGSMGSMGSMGTIQELGKDAQKNKWSFWLPLLFGMAVGSLLQRSKSSIAS